MHKDIYKIFTSLFIGILLFPIVAPAIELTHSDNFSLNLKGTYKNLFVQSQAQATGDPFLESLQRLRTEWEGSFQKILTAKIIWDNELIGGNYINTPEFGLRQTSRDEPYLNMDYELVHKNNFFYGQNFYRAYLQFQPGPFTLTVGRQKLDWGVMRFFSPADLYTRPSIFDVEREEKVGSTAANLSTQISPSTRLSSVYVIHPDFARSKLGQRLTQTLGRFDFSLLGGKVFRDGIVGLDFSGDVQKAGVRGELIFDRAITGDSFFQGATGIDYGFENSFYMALEYFYNGQGTNNALTSLPFPATGNTIQSVHQNFLGLQLKYDLTPLWIAFFQNIVDLNGGSIFMNPETKYSVYEWLDLTAGVQIPVGQGGGEFSSIPNYYYFQTQMFY